MAACPSIRPAGLFNFGPLSRSSQILSKSDINSLRDWLR
jgi:hypothetical protein